MNILEHPDPYDPTDPGVIADPYPALDTLRSRSPVAWSERLRSWLVTRHDDCIALQRDPRLSAERMAAYFQGLSDERRRALAMSERMIGTWSVFLDPPPHTRIRSHLNRWFTTRSLEAMKPRIERRIDDLLVPVRDREQMDFVADFAYPLPASVIMDMLGVPLDMLDDFQRWSHDVALFVGSSQTAPDKHLRAEEAIVGLAAVFRDLLAERRRAPDADMISELARQPGLSDDELVANCILLLFAGHETTTGLLSNGLMRLIQHPGQQALLRREPDRAEMAVEEMLRFDSPAPAISRVAATDLELRGRRIARGDRVFLMLNAANRDPDAFDEPDRFDITRRAGRHIAFGFGIHFCIGAPLARLEATLALPRVLAALDDIEQTDDAVTWRDGVSLRGLVSLPIRYQGRRAGPGTA